jgi:hypothetical protein
VATPTSLLRSDLSVLIGHASQNAFWGQICSVLGGCLELTPFDVAFS